LKEIEKEKYKKMVGNGAKTLMRRMVDAVGGTDEQYEKVLEDDVRTYDEDFMHLTTAFDGILDMLKELKENGIKVAVLSNKPDSTVKKISEELFGDALVDLCYGARENVPLKPDPTAVLGIIEEFGVSPEDCLYIGDTNTDIQTAKNAGLTSIGVLWGFRDREELASAGADYIVSHPLEIAKIAIN
jgi:phosphoglycolate phosphatase